MITSKQFIDMLNTAHDVPNKYNNKPGYNLGNFDGKKYNFDCWNLIKAILAGWTPEKGKTAPTVTGDIDGAHLLANCTQKSKDFSKLSVPGTYLYLSTNPHAGIFIGEFTKDGKTYNVIECTKNMYPGQDGVTYSYVDKSGARMPWKGGSAKGRWTDYGLLTKWVSYEDIPTPEPQPSGKPVLMKGSNGNDVKDLQNALNKFGYGLVVDGDFGPKTDSAVRDFQKNHGLKVDGKVGPLTWAELEKERKDDPEYYVVKSGDTFGAIAKKHGLTQKELAKLNPQIENINLIYKGQKIRVK